MNRVPLSVLELTPMRLYPKADDRRRGLEVAPVNSEAATVPGLCVKSCITLAMLALSQQLHRGYTLLGRLIVES